jgi:hypothetical protein
MRRTVRVLAVLALGALGCQDYNFNPVGHCLIQPGTRRVTLADVSSADILFVVDDSGSMSDNQTALANGFSSFMANLNAENASRVSRGLDPIDFHIAVTTTAIFIDNPASATCQATCGGLTNVCCSGGTPLGSDERTCAGAGSPCSSGYTCRNDCTQAPGGFVCCNASGVPERLPVSCTAAEVASATPCGRIDTRYPATCGTWGVGAPYAKYPRGNFVSLGSNPRVLHFDKKLWQPGGGGTNNAGQTMAQLQGWFTDNVKVGICGSGQEQGLDAARYAITRAFAGQQPGVAAGEWPHPNAKLVVVWVGDEDDCSSPEDPIDGIIYSGTPGNDACTNAPTSARRFPVTTYADFLTGLGRPLAVGFIEGAVADACVDVTPGDTNACFARASCAPAPGMRFIGDPVNQPTAPPGLARELQSSGVEVVAGSVCAPGPEYFGPVLSRIADIVKPPAVLTLPTTPASNDVSVLRVVDKNGFTRRTCVGPPAVGGDPATACGGACDWWFVSAVNSRTPSAPSPYAYIDHSTGNCEANPGETYSLDYLGRLPDASGCATAADCVALGGTAADWTCLVPTPGQPGTCVCAQ